MSENLVERFAALPGTGVVERLRWREGTLADYRVLAEFHYLRHAPVTATRVLVVEDEGGGVENRWEGMMGGINSKDEIRNSKRGCRPAEAGRAGRVVGVLVESLPALSCVLREVALGGRYSGWRDRGTAARLLNQEVRCISRVVVHPQWRGLGLAVRLVKRAIATMTTPYTEALAAMGHVHPFFRLAGMREYRRWPHAKDQRLIDALAWCGVEAWELASGERMRRYLEGSGSPQATRRGEFGVQGSEQLLCRELARWAGRGLSLEQQLEAARERLLCEPVYYLACEEETEDESRDSDGRVESIEGAPPERECDEGGAV